MKTCTRKKKEDSITAFDKRIQAAVIQAAVLELICLQDGNNGRLSHKAMQNGVFQHIKRKEPVQA
jgi:hypothetical protein